MDRVFRPHDNILAIKCAEYSLDVPGYYDVGGHFINPIMIHIDGKRFHSGFHMAHASSNFDTTFSALAMVFAEIHGVENAARLFPCIKQDRKEADNA